MQSIINEIHKTLEDKECSSEYKVQLEICKELLAELQDAFDDDLT